MKLMNNNVPVDLPSKEDFEKAHKILNSYFLHYYQLLYFNSPKLTQPGNGYPFHLSRSNNHSRCIEIKYVHATSNNFIFLITPFDNDKTVLDKCNAVLSAVVSNKQKCDSRVCCPLAELTNCVCEISFKCILHGTTCIGSHD